MRPSPTIRDVHPFEACTRSELAVVQSHATPAHLGRGALVCRAWSLAREAIVVIDGELEAHIGGLPLGVARAGQVLGVPLALSGRARWPYTATAAVPSDVLVIGTRELQRLVFEVPHLFGAFVEDAAALYDAA